MVLVVVVLAIGGYFAWRAFYPSGYDSSSSGSRPSNSDQVRESNTVIMSDFDFSPQELTVKAGAEVTFKNEDSASHTVTFSDFDSGSIQNGGNYKHTFDKAGTYDYHCTIHPSMQGKIVVE